MIRMRNLDPYVQSMINGSAIGQGELIHVCKTGEAPEQYFRYKRPAENVQQTVAAAFAQATSCRNDTIVVTPSNHQLSATLTWNKNLTHMVGSYVGSKMNIRNRIGMSTTFHPMINVTGYGNTFANIYTMHGTATGDSTGWDIDGNRNTFLGVHFGGPMNATQAGNVGYIGIDLDGDECTFKDCVIGTATQSRDTSNKCLTMAAPGRHHFENTDFMTTISDANAEFVSVENTDTISAFFKGCMFMALNPNWAVSQAIAFNFTGGATAAIIIDINCTLVNVDQWTSAANDQWGIWVPQLGPTIADADNVVRSYRPSLTT